MTHLIQDLRYAMRQLRRSPGFALTAVVTLALGIAANSTILSWISATLLNPIPGVRHTDNMLTIQRGERSEHATPPFSYPDYVDLRDHVTTLSGLLAYHDDFMSITSSAQPKRIYGAVASANYFEVLGVKPLMGRTLADTAKNEQAATLEAVLSYSLWQDQFGGDPNIVGKSVEINLHPYTVIGVAPQGFQGCKSGLRTDVWLPMGADQVVWETGRIKDRGASWLNVLGVLRPGTETHQAENEINVLMQRIVESSPAAHQGNNFLTTDPLWRSPFGANVYLSGTLPMLLALAAVLLLLACANVANLLLVRSVSRRREFAIRLSLGADRWILIRQLMIENLIVALAGGGLAMVSTIWTAQIMQYFLPSTILPLAMNARLDERVVVLTTVLSLLTAAVSGFVPAWRASQMAPMAALKDEALNTSGGLHKSRLASVLVMAQVALSLLLLACAGLFVRSLQTAEKADPGFDASHVMLATIDLTPMGYSYITGKEFQHELVSRLRQLPGVQAATLADFFPLSFTLHSEGVVPEGYVPRPHESMEADRGVVGAGYLATMRTSLLAGRDFADSDDANAQKVVIVNQAFVNRYWPQQQAIGKRVNDGRHWATVVGVSANGKYRRLINDPAPLVLYPLAQRYANEVILHVRATGEPQAMVHSIELTVHSLNANLPLYNVTTLRENMRLGSVFERIAVAFAGSFGFLALVLAGVGIYGVVAYSARQRTHEIGIRLALGAGKAAIFRQVLAHGARLTALGLGAGVLMSLFLTRFLRSALYGVGSADWITFVVVGLILCLVALLACFLPARRAASVDPMQSLRTE